MSDRNGKHYISKQMRAWIVDCLSVPRSFLLSLFVWVLPLGLASSHITPLLCISQIKTPTLIGDQHGLLGGGRAREQQRGDHDKSRPVGHQWRAGMYVIGEAGREEDGVWCSAAEQKQAG